MSSLDFRCDLDFTVRIGGEGGEGVISCGELFAQAAARTRNRVFTYITYPAEIRGGFSMIQIRVRDRRIYSIGSQVDYLVVFNQMAYDQAVADLRPGGVLIFDPETVEVAADLEAELFALPITRISTEKAGGVRAKNVVALGALGGLFGMDRDHLSRLLQDRYGKKGEKVVAGNLAGLEAGYEAVAASPFAGRVHVRERAETRERFMMLSGNEAVALGAIAAGCRFVAGYPITPATPILETLMDWMPRVGGRAIQCEDEIAAISAIIGASFAGEKVITPTSGPGLQLMGEQINLASMAELPVVIVDVQRGGPSTGLPTKTEQSDLKFAIYGTSGEAPRCIIAPTSVEDCFYQTIRAFNIAERFQMPVILLTDQSIGYRKATVSIPDFDSIVEVGPEVPSEEIVVPTAERIQIASRIPATELEGYERYHITDDGVSPITRPGTPGGQYLASGLEHDENGKADYSPGNHSRMTHKRFRKLEALSAAFEKNPPEYRGSAEAKIGIIGWGSTEGAIREARYLAEANGILIRHLHPRVVSPLPERQIRNFLAGLKQILVVEENYTGQFAHFIKAKFGIRPIELHKCQGVPITAEEIWTAIQNVEKVTHEESLVGI